MDVQIARKLGPLARRVLADPAGAAGHQLNLVVTTHLPPGPDDRQALARTGCHVRSVAGDVLTADLPAEALPALAALDVVRFVELSRPLRQEPEAGTPDR